MNNNNVTKDMNLTNRAGEPVWECVSKNTEGDY